MRGSSVDMTATWMGRRCSGSSSSRTRVWMWRRMEVEAQRGRRLRPPWGGEGRSGRLRPWHEAGEAELLLGGCGEGNRVDEDETQIWAAGAHLRRWWRRWSGLREGEDRSRRCRSGARGRARRRSGASAPSLFLAAREGTRG